jgi:hypothetical protein
MPKPAKDPEEEVLLELLCHSELVEIAKFNGIEDASRAVPREILIHAIENWEMVGIENPMDRTRMRLTTFFRRFWKRFQMQVPFRSPDAAMEFSDMEAAKYYVKNRDRLT